MTQTLRTDLWVQRGKDSMGRIGKVALTHTHSRLTLGDPRDCSLPGSSPQARILELVVISYPGDLPDSGVELTSLVSPVLAGRFISTGPPVVVV